MIAALEDEGLVNIPKRGLRAAVRIDVWLESCRRVLVMLVDLFVYLLYGICEPCSVPWARTSTLTLCTDGFETSSSLSI